MLNVSLYIEASTGLHSTRGGGLSPPPWVSKFDYLPAALAGQLQHAVHLRPVGLFADQKASYLGSTEV